jgi:F-type H+-transporting ATPase subunit c
MTKLIKWTPVVLVAFVVLGAATPAFADDANLWRGYVGVGFGLGLGLAVLGGTLGQAMAASSAYQSIARNPSAAGKLNAPFFVGLALIESLVIFAWLMVFIVQGSVFSL